MALHAEQNAVIHCDRIDLVDATIYITCAPCPGCVKMLSGTGLAKAIWPEGRLDLK